MRCEVCGHPGDILVFVRPQNGGKRQGFFACDADCKQYNLDILAAYELEETIGVRGWDVFWFRYE